LDYGEERLMSDQRVIGVIPARWASTRLPGKPLAMIAGKTDASPDQAEHYAGTVIAVMKKFISEGELHDVQAQLPKEFSRLFGVGPGEIRKPGLSGER